MAGRLRRIMERVHKGSAEGGLGRGEPERGAGLSRLVQGPGGDEYSIEVWLRAGWPFVSTFYELILGSLHERVFGYGIRVKRMPVSRSAPTLYEERFRGLEAAKARREALVQEIEAGRFGFT